MTEQYTEFQKRAIESVKRLWRLYVVNQEPEELESSFRKLPEDLLMIGTGRHEFYKNRNDFLKGMTADQVEARDIQFEVQDEWYETQRITDDVCLVYGGIWIREKSTPGKPVLIDMEGSRFTVVCRDTPDGVQICNVHHSMPYLDQGEDEYYPKSLASLANEAVRKSRALEHRIELDHMTELYNRIYMERHVSQVLKNESGYFLAIDLDDFKNVNDSKGHLMGDEVIREFSRALKRSFSPSAILGRMGGDEFAVWESGIADREAVENQFLGLLKECRELSKQLDVSVSCSVGIAKSRRMGEDFTELYRRADKALYHAKGQGKGVFCWAPDFEQEKE